MVCGAGSHANYAVYLDTLRGSAGPCSNLSSIYGRVMIALYFFISAAGAKESCGRRAARKTFISSREKRQPMQACGPKVKDMRFARPGCGEALVGSDIHLSGLKDNASAPHISLL